MQNYDDFLPFPRNYTNTSSSCMDKHLIFGQIEENSKKVVQTFEGLEQGDK